MTPREPKKEPTMTTETPAEVLAHPIQPLEIDERGTLRFKKNAIVRHLLDHGGIDMNDLAVMDFSPDDREQFAQLIGYSHDGAGTLSYFTDKVWYAAQEEYESRGSERSLAAWRVVTVPSPEQIAAWATGWRASDEIDEPLSAEDQMLWRISYAVHCGMRDTAPPADPAKASEPDVSDGAIERALDAKIGLDHTLRQLIRGDTMAVGFSKADVVRSLLAELGSITATPPASAPEPTEAIENPQHCPECSFTMSGLGWCVNCKWTPAAVKQGEGREGVEELAITLAEDVRTALDRQSCPDHYMRIAYETVESAVIRRLSIAPQPDHSPDAGKMGDSAAKGRK
jgi:hypothetical protein